MKRLICLTLVLAVLLCGCADSQTEGTTAKETENVTESPVDVTEIERPDVTLPRNELETEGEATVPVEHADGEKVTYSTNISSVRYITRVEDLPDYEALAGYDEAYFETGALVVVLETVNSGSVKVSIASIDDGVVTLSHESTGDVGTTVMTTWLLWAEVEPGLEYTWSVANPAIKPNVSAY